MFHISIQSPSSHNLSSVLLCVYLLFSLRDIVNDDRQGNENTWSSTNLIIIHVVLVPIWKRRGTWKANGNQNIVIIF